MDVLRTPEDRFTGLPDFDHQPRYATVADGLRMAYVEAGPPTGPPVLLLHGEPTWSYLYRHVIPGLADAGLRVVAPDLIGFGRSDKPVETGDHTYARQVEWVRSFAFDVLDLREPTLVGHDWGGLIGLRLATEQPDRVGRVVATNTGLPTGDQRMPELWLRFREAVRTAPVLDVARLVSSGCLTELAPSVLAAYDAPFPDETFKAAPRAMPNLVPTTPDDPASAAEPDGLAAAGRLGQAVPGGLQRQRPHHVIARSGAGPARARRRVGHHPRCRSLRAGGQPGPAGRRDRGLRGGPGPMRTTVCVVGGGPAGLVAALLFARQGIEVTVVEKHADFLRDFRGDTVHPSTLTLLDEIGLGDAVARLPGRRNGALAVTFDDGTSG